MTVLKIREERNSGKENGGEGRRRNGIIVIQLLARIGRSTVFFSNGHSWNRCSTFVRKITGEGAGGGVRFPTIFQRTHPVSSLYLFACVAWIAWPPFKRSPRVSYKKLRGPEILVRRSNVGIARWKKPTPSSSFWGQRIISVTSYPASLSSWQRRACWTI